MHVSPNPPDGERVLVYGPPGTGKSSAAIALVADGQRVTVIDTENTYARMVGHPAPDNVTIHNLMRDAMVEGVDVWPMLIETLRDELRDAEIGDWLVIDSFTPLWDECQSHYITQVFGAAPVNYFLERRREMEIAQKAGNALDGNHDWTYINKMFNELYNILLNYPGHVMLTAEGAKLDDRDKPEIHKEFGGHGYKPKGQKRLAYIPKTVLLTTRRSSGGWYIDTVKDRERDELAGVEVTRDEGGFVDAYLVEIADWSEEVTATRELTAREKAALRAQEQDQT